MKNKYTRPFFFILLIIALFSEIACSSNINEINSTSGRLVKDVVIPTAITAYKGMPYEINGNGFSNDDEACLKVGEKELPARTTFLSDQKISVEIPDESETNTTYRFILRRGDNYQILGTSKLTITLVADVNIPSSLILERGGLYTFGGLGFKPTDKIVITQNGNEIVAPVQSVTETSVTITMPDELNAGTGNIYIKRNDEKQALGTTILYLPVADKAGANIKGFVHCGGYPLENVLVSDGEKIVKTNADGHYWMESKKENGLAFVIMPSGYETPVVDAKPQFWQTCLKNAQTSEQIDFELIESNNTNHKVIFATDMHLADRNSPKDYIQFEKFINEMNSDFGNPTEKVYCLNLGDFSWDAFWYSNKWALPECLGATKALPMPMWVTMGNHDNDPYIASDFNAEAPFRHHVGPVYYSMNIGDVHYIMLDNSVYKNTGASEGTIGDRSYDNVFTDKQLDWLKENLKHVNKGTPIVIGIHCPVYYYSGINNISIAMKTAADADNFLSCFDGFHSVNIFSGHTHVNRNIQSPKYSNIYEHNIAAVCATWWWTQRYAGNDVCQDGSPAGYKVLEVNGTDFKWYYKGTGMPREKQFMTYDMNEVKSYWSGNETALKAFNSGYMNGRQNEYSDVDNNIVYINVWSYEPGWTIKVTENGQEIPVTQVWKRDPLHTISYDIPRAAGGSSLSFATNWCAHMFAVNASSASSALEINVTDRFGNSFSETMIRPKAFTTIQD